MSRRVVGAVAVVPDGEGKLRYFYRGSYLPDGLDGDAVERCIARGLVAEVEDPAPAPEDPDAPEGDESADPEAAVDGEAPEPAQVERPKRTGTREAWANYRAAQGHKVDGLTRDELVALPDKP